MKAGFSKKILPSPLDIKLDGYAARFEYPKGVHDNLYVRTLVLEVGDRRIVLASYDLLGLDGRFVEELENVIKREKLADFVIINTTHTHSATATGLFRPTKTWWWESIKSATLDTIREAYRTMKEARIWCSSGEVKGVFINRRNLKGPYDPVIPVVKIADEDDNYISLVVSAACHAVVLGPSNLYVSADYPGALCSFVEKNLGGGCIFLQGYGGDINPLDATTNLEKVYARHGTFREVERLGRVIGSEAVKIAETLFRNNLEEDVSYYEERLKLRVENIPPPEESWRKYQQALEKIKKSAEYEEKVEAGIELMTSFRLYKFYRRVTGGEVETTVKALRLGKVIFVTGPGEMFVEIGLSLKEKYPDYLVVPVGYAEDYLGYIPTLEEYQKGGYEITFPWRILTKDAIQKTIKSINTAVEKVI